MTPEYLMELADLADPDQLWRRSGIERRTFTEAQRRQVDTGVALRRHAAHVRRLNDLKGTGHSLLITPLGYMGQRITTIETPLKEV